MRIVEQFDLNEGERLIAGIDDVVLHARLAEIGDALLPLLSPPAATSRNKPSTSGATTWSNSCRR
jgi:hypothetical protein